MYFPNDNESIIINDQIEIEDQNYNMIQIDGMNSVRISVPDTETKNVISKD